MENLRQACTIPFNMESKDHRIALFSFGAVALGEGVLRSDEALLSERWGTIGFQGNNPATDFRAAGLFGLQNLHYFVTTNPAQFSRMVNRSTDREHYLPVALAGLNLTFKLTHLLCASRPLNTMLSQQEAEIFSAFLTLLQADEYVFEEIYCSAFLYLDHIWVKHRKRYREFNAVLEEVRDAVVNVLVQHHPTSVREFLTLMTNLMEPSLPRYTGL